MKTIAKAVALAMVTMVFVVQAQPRKLMPGLWEMSSKMQSGSGALEKAMAEAQKQMASLPPEQRKMMQDMMAKQGVGLGAGGPGGMTVKICMTKEMIDRDEIAAQEGDCKTTRAPWVGNSMKMSFTCTKPPSKGEGLVTIISPQAYSMKMTVDTTANGKPERMTMDNTGKWLSAECGNVRPIGQIGK